MRANIGCVCLLLFYGACDKVAYQKTPSGLEYRIIKEKRKESSPKPNTYFKFRLDKLLADSVLYRTPKGKYEYFLFTAKQMPSRTRYDIIEIFNYLRKYDSVVVRVPLDSMYQGQNVKSKGNYYPGKYLFFKIKVFDVLTRAQKEEEETKAQETLAGQETAAIQSYVMRKKWRVVKKDSVYISYNKQGKAQAAPSEFGDTVYVRYRGFLLDGQEFDTNLGADNRPLLRFVLGKNQVITGFERACLGVLAGTEMDVVLPSAFAYGSAGAGSVIPPDAPLHFYIQIVKITKP